MNNQFVEIDRALYGIFKAIVTEKSASQLPFKLVDGTEFIFVSRPVQVALNIVLISAVNYFFTLVVYKMHKLKFTTVLKVRKHLRKFGALTDAVVFEIFSVLPLLFIENHLVHVEVVLRELVQDHDL